MVEGEAMKEGAVEEVAGGVDIATKCSDTSFSAILASASLHVWQKSLHNTSESKIRAKHSAHVSSSKD